MPFLVKGSGKETVAKPYAAKLERAASEPTGFSGTDKFNQPTNHDAGASKTTTC
jgi:hypothetical protein